MLVEQAATTTSRASKFAHFYADLYSDLGVYLGQTDIANSTQADDFEVATVAMTGHFLEVLI